MTQRYVWLIVFILSGLVSISARAADLFDPPASQRLTLDMNPNWLFIKQDVADASGMGFDDSAWSVVSTPHTYNDTDTFNKIISHGGGQAGEYLGPAWYRKHFKLPSELKGRHFYLEFEGMRQAGQIYLNGKNIGLYENGVTAYGIDITSAVTVGGGENVLAVRVDNGNYAEKSSGQGFEWESKDFNPNYGGINRHVWLHVTGPIHQTLPLNYGLATLGVYVYPSNFDLAGGSADINVESQVANESGDNAPVTLSVVVADLSGKIVAKFDGDPVDMVDGEKTIHKVTGKANGLTFWSPEHPALYDVYTMLSADGKVVDVVKTRTGFRQVDFRGGVGTGGVYINGKFCYLKGYSQRASDEWAGLGQAYPDWMHDLTAKLIRDSHANYVRWMHISPQKTDVQAYDKYGIVEVCPAGDKEKDAKGRQWEQRVEVMHDSIIYYRNNPSILFWEAGNNGVTAAHMKEMVDLKEELDPNGQRAMGCRSLTEAGTTEAAQYYGVMIGQDDAKDTKRSGPTDLFRAYSDERRDRAPLIETEDFRDEGARRFWDDYSPPHFGFKPGPKDTYHWNSETFALAQAERYWAYFSNRISNTDSKHSKWSGYASIYFSDSNADGRQDSSEVCRVSGKVDAVRLPKEIYFTEQVMQNPEPDLHILGHWTYPSGTKKTVYVISNCQSVELTLNGRMIGRSEHPSNGYVFGFADVGFEPGTLVATGFHRNKKVCEQKLSTAGNAAAIKLTSITGPGGLYADGADVALFDVEVVDAKGRRCPTDEARIDFSVSGPGVWRGGYNSGIVGSTNNLSLLDECGINRVAIRSTLTAGKISLTARREGLKSATAEVTAKAVVQPDVLMVAGERRGLAAPEIGSSSGGSAR
jgi:beta-galactosidase